MRASGLTSFCLAFVAACNVSPVPIAPLSEAPFDSALIGVWDAPDPHSSGDSMTITILEYRAPEYYIEVVNKESLFDIVRARGFVTRIGDATFMNADELNSKPRGYTFYRYSISGDTLIVRGVAEASQKFTASEDLRAFLTVNLQSDSLYDDTVRFLRIKK